ncbi:MAG: hypothetical protein U0263_41150 [Polyangiaceae bacterium]
MRLGGALEQLQRVAVVVTLHREDGQVAQRETDGSTLASALRIVEHLREHDARGVGGPARQERDRSVDPRPELGGELSAAHRLTLVCGEVSIGQRPLSTRQEQLALQVASGESDRQRGRAAEHLFGERRGSFLLTHRVADLADFDGDGQAGFFAGREAAGAFQCRERGDQIAACQRRSPENQGSVIAWLHRSGRVRPSQRHVGVPERQRELRAAESNRTGVAGGRRVERGAPTPPEIRATRAVVAGRERRPHGVFRSLELAEFGKQLR